MHSFTDSLHDAKKKKESEIDRICSRHYGDFLTSVSEMLKLRGAAGHLTELVQDVHEKFNTTGAELVQVLDELQKIQTERENARRLLEAAIHSKNISALMVQTRALIEADDHYSAMRAIEAVQREAQQPLTVKAMADMLSAWVPVAINKLLYAVRSEADSFIDEIRKYHELIGSTLMIRRARLSVAAAAAVAARSTMEAGFHSQPAAAVGAAATPSGGEPSPQSPLYRSPRRGGGGSSPFRTHALQRHFSMGSQSIEALNHNNLTAAAAAAAAAAGGGSGGAGAAGGAAVLLTSQLSTSLKHIVAHGEVFNLMLWAKPSDFEGVVPAHFTARLSAAGEDVVDSQLCDLAPLHKVLHLYGVLSDLNAYHEHYRYRREAVLQQLLQTVDRVANQSGLVAALPRFYDQLLGFFAHESIIRRSVEVPEGAFSFEELLGLWDRACRHLSALVGQLAITVTSSDALIRIKEDTLVLIEVITDDSIGLPPHGLYEIIRGMWEPFQGLQINEVVRACTAALESCAFQPYVASTAEQMQTEVRAFHLDVIDLSNEDFYFTRATQRAAAVAAAGILQSSSTHDDESEDAAVAVVVPADTHRGDVSAAATAATPSGSDGRSSFRPPAGFMRPHILGAGGRQMQTMKASAALDALEEEMQLDLAAASSATSASENVLPVLNRNGMGSWDADLGLDVGGGGQRQQQQQQQRGPGGSGMLSRRQSLRMQLNRRTSIGFGASMLMLPQFQPFQQQSFPFSSVVPILLRELHLTVIRYFLFAVRNTELGTRSEEICTALVQAFQTICQCLLRALQRDGMETPLSKACQISIDAAAISQASDALWEMVQQGMRHFHWTEKLEAYITRSVDLGMMNLRQLVTQAQDMIFELMSDKIDGLLESMQFINFLPQQQLPICAHDCVDQIVSYLQFTFMWLTHLPPSVRDAVHFTCCSHVAAGLLEYLISPQKVKACNVLCIKEFEYDVRRLMEFADCCGVRDLRQCFEELHETIGCLLSPQLPQMAENIALRKQRFPYVNASKLVAVLEKVTATNIFRQPY